MKFNSKIVDAWVQFWNTYDLSKIEELFLTDEHVTYFSSEKEGLIKGIEALRKHHEGFGFVKGGKSQPNKLWLEETFVDDFGKATLVCAIWCFKRPNQEKPQRGPVTIVYVETVNGWRIAHANFGNYKAN
jgi:hypothetical protein